MSRSLLALIALAALPGLAFGQAWSDDFESYAAGYLCYQDPSLVPGAPCAPGSIGNSGGWDGWFNNPLEAGQVINAPGMGSNGSNQYFDISPGIGSQDAVQPFKPNVLTAAGAASGALYTSYPTAGGWVISADFQVPAGGSALGTSYFIVNNDYDNAGTATSWSAQFSIAADAAVPGQITVTDDLGAGASVAGLSEGVWYRITMTICLDANTCDNSLAEAGPDGILGTGDDVVTPISSRTYASGGPTEIACLDLYSAGGSLWYDNCSLTPFGDWETNSPESSLDIDGVVGSSCQQALSSACVGGTMNLNSSATASAPFDIAVTFSAAVPNALATGGGQIVNVNIGDPSLFNFNGPPATFAGLLNLQPHPGAFTFAVPTAAPLLASGQQLAIDVAHPDGFQLSQAVEANVTSGGGGTPQTLALPDDGNVNILLTATHPCPTSISFYGTTYTDLYVNSNGDVSFTAGHGDFSATSGEWQTQFPRMGFQSDLEPNNFGTISITNNGPTGIGDWVVVSYSNITEWGTGGTGVTSYDVVFHGPNGHEIGNFTTDGTWGASATVMGISNGSLGTNPALVSFDLLNGAGLQANPLASDSVIDENVGGMIINTTMWSSIQFPLFDGSAFLVL